MRLRSRAKNAVDPEKHDASGEKSCSDKITQVTQRVLSRSHRAHPELVKSLTLAHSMLESLGLPRVHRLYESILEICQFSQRTKWLSPWGSEIVNEAQRLHSLDLPESISRNYDAIRLNEYHPDISTISTKAVHQAMGDAAEKWEKVFLFQQTDLEYLANLHLHPCEELHLHQCVLRQADVRSILRCKAIRVLSLHNTQYPRNFIAQIAQFKNVEALRISQKTALRHEEIAMLQHLPLLHSIELVDTNGTCADVHDIEDALLQFILNRQPNLRVVHFSFPVDRYIIEALAKCANLHSVLLTSPHVGDEICALLLSKQSIRENLTEINFSFTDIGSATFELLEKCTNIRRIDLSSTAVRTEHLQRLILKNAAHIREVLVVNCPLVSNDILHTLRECTDIHLIALEGTKVTAHAIERYTSNKKRHFEAIRMQDVIGIGSSTESGTEDIEDDEWQ